MKTKSRLVPAGMILKTNDYCDNSNRSRRSGKPSRDAAPMDSTHSASAPRGKPSRDWAPRSSRSKSTSRIDTRHSISPPKKIFPPKTICKKKESVLVDFQGPYNQNCIFNRDVNVVRKQLSTLLNKNFNVCKATSQNSQSGDYEENWNLPSTSSSQMHNQNSDRRRQVSARPSVSFNTCKTTFQNSGNEDWEENWDLPFTSSSQTHNQNTDRCRKQLPARSNRNFNACKTASQNIDTGDHERNCDVPSTSSSEMDNQKTDRCSVPSTSSSQMTNQKTDRCSVTQNTTEEVDTDSSVEANSLKKKSTSSVKNDLAELLPEKNQRFDLDSETVFEAWCIDNLKFDESDTSLKNPPLLTSTKASKSVSINKINKSHIVVHGIVIEKPIKSIDEIRFDKDVKDAMIKFKCSTPTPIQTYMWSTIQRGLDAFVVAPPGAGKTFSYLPGLFTKIMRKESEVTKYQGPLIVILCPDDAKCQDIKTLVNSINEESWGRMVTNAVHGDSTKSDYDVLITTPRQFKFNLETKAVKLERVAHVVLEEAHILLKENSKFMSTLFKILNQIKITRPSRESVQIIVCSEKWSKDLHVLLENLHTIPVIVFQDFFEAALYANVRNERKMIKPSSKIYFLMDKLKHQYSTHRTVVFCKNDEIVFVSERLQMDGIECISLSGDLIEDDIFENEDMWRSLKLGSFKVLLCTDSLLDKTLEILNAEWIIHYSPPANWKIFQKRFRCLVKNLHCPLDEDFEQKEDMLSCFIAESEESCNEIFVDYYDALIRNQVTHFNL